MGKILSIKPKTASKIRALNSKGKLCDEISCSTCKLSKKVPSLNTSFFNISASCDYITIRSFLLSEKNQLY